MKTRKTLFRYGDDVFDRRLDRMHASLQELGAILDRQQQQRPPIEPRVVTRVIYQPVFYPQPAGKNKHKPVLIFPFTVLDQVMERFVKTVIDRQIGRIQRFLGVTKR